MPRLRSLAIQCSDHRASGSLAQFRWPFEDVACLASHQTQLTSLTFGRSPIALGARQCPYYAPHMTWLPRLPHLRRLHLPGLSLRGDTVAALAQLTGLQSLEVHLNCRQAYSALQAALQQLHGLSSLAAVLPSTRLPALYVWDEAEEEEEEEQPLDVGVVPQLAELRLSRGGVCRLAAAPLTFLMLDETEFDMQDLCGCSRLVGLHCLLHSFSASLEDYRDAAGDAEQGLPLGCLPALRSLSLLVPEHEIDYHTGGTVPLPSELSALTGLTSLQVEGPAVHLLTIEDWRTRNEHIRYDLGGEEPDSYALESESLEDHRQLVPAVRLPGPAFYLPHLRELSLVSCRLEAVPECVAGLPELHTLRVSGNNFNRLRFPDIFLGLPGPVCSTLRRLEMQGCFLRAVPPFLSHLTALTALVLSGNRTLEIQRSDARLFSRLSRLRELRLAKPRSLTGGKIEWTQDSVAALLGVQRACAWLDVQRALEPEGAA